MLRQRPGIAVLCYFLNFFLVAFCTPVCVLAASPATDKSLNKLSELNKELRSEHLKSLCSHGDGEACLKFSQYLLDKKDDLRGSFLALQLGCARKNKPSCDRIEADQIEGEKIRKQCDAGDAKMCHTYAYGQSKMYNNHVLSTEYLKKGCALKYKPSCDSLNLSKIEH